MVHLDNLSEYLKNSKEKTVVLSFEEIEKIIGERLPEKAKNNPNWWWNVNNGVRAKAWMMAGYVTSNCKNIPITHNVIFIKNSDSKCDTNHVKGIKKVWFILANPESESNKRLVMIIQLIGLVLAVLAIIIPYIISNIMIEKSLIEITDIKFIDSDSIEKVKLELTFNNNNPDYDRYINKAIIHVLDYYEMSFTASGYPYMLDSSYTYNLLIDGNTIPEDFEIELSQVIPAGGYDKFSIELCAGDVGTFLEVLICLNIELVFDNADTISTDKCILCLGSPVFDEETVKSFSLAWRGLYDNLEAISRFNDYKCKYVMKNFEELYNSYNEYRDLILKIGKPVKEMQMKEDDKKISPMYLSDFLNFFCDSNLSGVINEKNTDEGILYYIVKSNNDKKEPDLYLLCDGSNRVKSIFVKAVKDSHLRENNDSESVDDEILINEFLVNHEGTFVAGFFIELIDPSVDRYWFDQRIVDLGFHEGLRFWSDDNIFAYFETFQGMELLRFDLKY